MWALSNSTPYAAGSSWGRDKDGVHEWIVAVKAAFDIKPDGSLALADEQSKPLLAPEYHGDEAASSLRYDVDIVAPKPTTDVVLNGTAYAPNGRPSNNFVVELRVGNMYKAIRVIGNRTWGEGIFDDAPTAPQPVSEVAILYERAYGGHDKADPDPAKQAIDLRNPIGVGVASRRSHRAGTPLPNFEYLSGSIEKAGPAGFGAICSHWSPRIFQSGTYDAKWEETRKPLLPTDWDPRSLQCAPADQQTQTTLRGGEPVELTHLTRDGRLRFDLPRIHLAFTTHIDGRKEEHRGRVSAVILEPDLPRVIIVYTTALTVRTDGDYLDKTVIREKKVI